MATWSTIKLTEIRPDRFDAEYFRLDYKKNIAILQKTGDTTNLGKLFKVVGRGEKAEYIKEGNIPVLRSVNIRALGFNDVRQEYVAEEFYKQKPNGRVLKDDILITSTGTGTLGRTSIWHKDSRAFNVPENSYLRTPIKIDPYLIATYLNTQFGINQLFQHQRGSSGQLHLYPIDIRRVIVPIFLVQYQNKISKNLKAAFELQELSQTLYKQATNLLDQELALDNSDLQTSTNKYSSTFNEVVLGKRLDPEYYNPKARTIVERITKLEHTTVSQHFTIKNGFPWNSKQFFDNNSGEPVIRIRDVKPTYIDIKKLTSIESNYVKSIGFEKAKAGDVVVGMDGLKYFYASLLEENCLVNQRVCHITPKATSRLSSEYITFLINSKYGQAQLMRDMTIATTVGHITNANVARLVIPIVSDEFHRKITDLVRSAIDAEKQSKLLLKEATSTVEKLIEEAANK